MGKLENTKGPWKIEPGGCARCGFPVLPVQAGAPCPDCHPTPPPLVSVIAWPEKCVLGAYSIGPSETPGNLWIKHEGGEAGDFPAALVETAIATLFREHF